MVMSETEGAIFNSTTCSASRRTVQRVRPFGAGEQASAVRRASNPPSKVMFAGLALGLRARAASSPSSTKRSLRCSMVRAETPRAVATSATFQDSPAWGPTSHNNSARAWMNFGALVLPLRVKSRNCLRSSSVRVIRYRVAMRTSSAKGRRLQCERFHVTGY